MAAREPSAAHDYVVGSGTFGPACYPAEPCPFFPNYRFEFTVAAHADALGRKPRGYFRRTNVVNGNSQGGPVDCLNVVGNEAVVAGVDELDPRPHVRGTFYVQYFVDNDGDGIPDLVSPIAHVTPGTFGTPSDFPATCPPPVSPFGYLPLTSGDVVVNDADCARIKENPNGKVKCKAGRAG